MPGIEASTGSLGHGLSMAVGMGYAEKIRKTDGRVYCVLSDGELQEGSTWEALMMASFRGFQSGRPDRQQRFPEPRPHLCHTPGFYPLRDKLEAFGWEVAETDGHDSGAIYDAIAQRSGDKPFALIGATTKGKGVYMENVPMWHYRSWEEYEQAMRELGGAE